MTMTMLQIVQAAAGELGIPTPNLVVGSTTTDTLQLLALANRAGNNLRRGFIWQALCKEYRFYTQFLVATGTITANSAVITGLSSTTGLDSTYQVVATGVNNDTNILTKDSATQVTMNQPATISGTGVTIYFCKVQYTFPSDYDRMEDRTQWDKSKHWEMLGPETAEMWQWLKSGYISTGPRIRWRIFGSYFQIWPAVSTAEYLGFEYISNGWVTSSTGAPKNSFTADNDTCIFPDELMIVALKRQYQKAKGLGAEFDDEYNELLSIAQANDAGSADLHMAPNPLNTLIGWENIPDSNYGN